MTDEPDLDMAMTQLLAEIAGVLNEAAGLREPSPLDMRLLQLSSKCRNTCLGVAGALCSVERTILLWIVSFCFLWSSNGIIFMLPTILVQRGLPLTQILVLLLVQALVAIVGYTACSFLIDCYGRRSVLFLYYFVGAFFHLWFAYAAGIWLYVAIGLVGWVNPGVYGASGVYVSELYPTHLRATAVGWFFGIGRIGSFLAPTVVGFMLQYGAGAYVLHTFALTFLIAAIALWFVGVETKGKTLEEISGSMAPVGRSA
jgi:MFS transporter, putative metabolite:H+ symporter